MAHMIRPKKFYAKQIRSRIFISAFKFLSYLALQLSQLDLLKFPYSCFTSGLTVQYSTKTTLLHLRCRKTKVLPAPTPHTHIICAALIFQM